MRLLVVLVPLLGLATAASSVGADPSEEGELADAMIDRVIFNRGRTHSQLREDCITSNGEYLREAEFSFCTYGEVFFADTTKTSAVRFPGGSKSPLVRAFRSRLTARFGRSGLGLDYRIWNKRDAKTQTVHIFKLQQRAVGGWILEYYVIQE
jgi:hypothetical protein